LASVNINKNGLASAREDKMIQQEIKICLPWLILPNKEKKKLGLDEKIRY
jgi:hypothetical protein